MASLEADTDDRPLLKRLVAEVLQAHDPVVIVRVGAVVSEYDGPLSALVEALGQVHLIGLQRAVNARTIGAQIRARPAREVVPILLQSIQHAGELHRPVNGPPLELIVFGRVASQHEDEELGTIALERVLQLAAGKRLEPLLETLHHGIIVSDQCRSNLDARTLEAVCLPTGLEGAGDSIPPARQARRGQRKGCGQRLVAAQVRGLPGHLLQHVACRLDGLQADCDLRDLVILKWREIELARHRLIHAGRSRGRVTFEGADDRVNEAAQLWLDLNRQHEEISDLSCAMEFQPDGPPSRSRHVHNEGEWLADIVLREAADYGLSLAQAGDTKRDDFRRGRAVALLLDRDSHMSRAVVRGDGKLRLREAVHGQRRNRRHEAQPAAQRIVRAPGRHLPAAGSE